MLLPLRHQPVTRHKLFSSLIFAGLLAAVIVLPAPCCHAASPPTGSEPTQWRLIWKESPATSATISWSTRLRGKVHQVRFASVDGKEKGVVECHRNGPFTGEMKLYYHHAKLSGLRPSTRYNLTLDSDKNRSRTFYFITAPNKDQPFSILFGGDSRSGREARQDVNRMMAQMLARQSSLMAFAHGGDFIATGTSLKQWAAWMSDHELTTAKDGRLLPIIPTRGNHDKGPLFNQVFDFPDENENIYATSLSPTVRMLTLNTNVSTAGDQAQWLEAQLARWRPKSRWLLAQYHRPAYPAVKSPGGAKQHWVPLFEKYNLDLACESDGHNIKRTLPIRNDKHHRTGVTYIGEGGLGVGQRTPKTDRWYLQPPAKTGVGHHVQRLTFSEQGLKCEVVLLGGKIFDSHTLQPRK